jgi:hypothetical protein
MCTCFPHNLFAISGVCTFKVVSEEGNIQTGYFITRGGSGLDFSGLGRAQVVTFGLGIFWAFQFKNQAWGFQNLGYYNRPENL